MHNHVCSLQCYSYISFFVLDRCLFFLRDIFRNIISIDWEPRKATTKNKARREKTICQSWWLALCVLQCLHQSMCDQQKPKESFPYHCDYNKTDFLDQNQSVYKLILDFDTRVILKNCICSLSSPFNANTDLACNISSTFLCLTRPWSGTIFGHPSLQFRHGT